MLASSGDLPSAGVALRGQDMMAKGAGRPRDATEGLPIEVQIAGGFGSEAGGLALSTQIERERRSPLGTSASYGRAIPNVSGEIFALPASK